MPTKKDPDLFDALLTLSEQVIKQAKEPNILAYEPHLKQRFFHCSDDHIKLYIGGNRSGKTFGTVVEDIWWATGTHPFIRTPVPPIRGRVVAVDLLQGVYQIILPLFKRLCVASQLKGGSWDKAFDNYRRILTFANGSTIEFMSYEMGTEKFAGTSRHFIHFDEEPPKNIFDECMARLIDTEGCAWISMTPVEGLTWLYDSIYKPVAEAEDRITIHDDVNLGEVYRSPERETTIIEVSTDENPHLTKKGKERYFRNLDEDEKAARSRGAFVQKAGLVFKNFKPETHVIPKIGDPAGELRGSAFYSSVDHGWNNPTCWLWHAVRPDGTIITFGEHYGSEITIAEHASIVHAREAQWGIIVEHRTGDPAMRQTSGITGTSPYQEYANRDLYLELNSVPRDVAAGLAKMQMYFRLRNNGKPTWFITEDCVNFIRELQGLHFKKFVSKKAQYDNNVHEEIQKKDDHSFDSARYFATFLPDLTPDEPVEDTRPKTPGPYVDYDKALYEMVMREQEEMETVWTTVESF